jgi:hypothetical protein
LMKLHTVIIHQDIEPSKSFDRCLHDVTASVFLPQICSYRQTVSAKHADDLLRFGRILVFVKIRDTRSAPSLAKAIATARPIPLSPPVTIATLFFNFPLPK